MARSKKDGKFITLYLEKDVIDTLEQYSQDSGMSKTSIVERAVRKYTSTLDKMREMMSDSEEEI